MSLSRRSPSRAPAGARKPRPVTGGGGHVARKRFGQNFLQDQGIIDSIVRAIDPQPDERLIEIGPGLAALTQPLVERDWPKLRVVGNLPYNISTPILFHLLDHVDVVQDQHFMLQKEVIDRMVATPAQGDYSRLSVMLQWRYAMEQVLFVPPESFDPPPKVNSAVVRMVPLAKPPELDVPLFGSLVQSAFSQRRKLLRHTLGRWLEARGFTGGFDVQRRAEEVPVQEYTALAAGL